MPETTRRRKLDAEVPPHDADAEAAYLASIILGAAPVEALRDQDFYGSDHRTIHTAVRGVLQDGQPADAVTVAEWLDARKLLDEISGWLKLTEILERVPTPEHAETYARIILELSERRRLIEAASALMRRGYDRSVEIAELREQAAEFGPFAFDRRDDVLPRPVPIGDLMQQFPTLREPIIEGLLRTGEVANVVAPSKAGKSWLTAGLLLCVATGRPWFDRFECRRGRVLLLDNELHCSDIGHRIPAVAEAMGIKSSAYMQQLDVISLRGRRVDLYGLERIIAGIPRGEYTLVIGDAWYRLVPSGVSENENGAVMQLYNRLDEYVERLGSAWLGVHHSSKGDQSSKSVTDVGSGAGSQSRACDAHLVLRPHEEEGVVVLDAALRSFPPIDPLPLRWQFPLWTPDEELDPTLLRRPKTRQQAGQEQRDDEGCGQIVEALRENGPSTERAIRKLTGMGPARAERLLAGMVRDGRLIRRAGEYRGNETLEYVLAEYLQRGDVVRGADH